MMKKDEHLYIGYKGFIVSKIRDLLREIKEESSLQFVDRDSPLLISTPHAGVEFPSTLIDDYHSSARWSEDTDWYIDRLYATIADRLNASTLSARWSRFLIDLNRSAEDQDLYPGQNSTGLFPDRSFAGDPVYQVNKRLTLAQKKARINQYWMPYHHALQTILEDKRNRFGYAILWEAHSIRSTVPYLFNGTLPHINLGTNNGRTAPQDLGIKWQALINADGRYLFADNARFKGGYITRNYADLTKNIYTIQLELTQSTYLDESYIKTGQAPDWDEHRANEVRPLLTELISLTLSCCANRSDIC